MLSSALLISVVDAPDHASLAAPIASQRAHANPVLWRLGTGDYPVRSLSTPAAFDVQKTIVLFNRTVYSGNFVSSPIQYPLPVAVNTRDGSLWIAANPRGALGDTVNTSVGRVNVRTGQVDLTNDSGNYYGFGLMMYDPNSNLMFVGGGGLGVQEWNGSSGTYVRTTPLSSPTALALDTDTNQVYAVKSSEVQVLDVSTNRIVANVSVGNNPFELGFDPLNHSMVATNEGPAGFTGTSYLSFINDTNYTWFDTNIPNIGSGYHASPGNVAFNPINGTILSPTAYGENLAIFNATNGSLTQLFNVAPASISPYTVTYDPATEGYWVALDNGTFKLLDRNFSVTGYDYEASVGGVVAYDNTTNSMLVPDYGAWAGGGVYDFNATTSALTGIWNLSGPAPLGTAFGGPSDTLFVDGYGQRDIWTVNSTSDLPGPTLTSAFTGGPWRSVIADGSLFTTETNNGSVERWNDSSPFGFLGAARADPSFAGAPFPEGIAFDAFHDRLLVADNGSSQLSVIDPLNLTNQTTVNVGTGPSSVVVVPTLGEYFVIDAGANKISVVNASTLRVVSNVSLSNLPIEGTFDSAASAVLVTEMGGHAVAEIPTSTLTPHLIATGAAPIGVAYDPLDDAVVVANSGSNNVTVLNGTTLHHDTDLATGRQPETVSVDPTSGELAVANYQSDSLSLINGCLRASCLYVEQFGATPATLSVGSSTNLSVEVSGAVGAVTYSYSGLPPGCASMNRSSLACAPRQPGTFAVSVRATDSTGTSSRANLTLTVRPSPTPLAQSFIITPSTVIVGDTVTLNFSVEGGVLPYSFAYTGLPRGCQSNDSAVWTCWPLVAGNFTVDARVRDANGSTASADSTLNSTYGAAPVITGLVATPSPATINETVLFSLSVTGGWGWINTTWPVLPVGCTGANTTVLACVPMAAGNYSVVANVSDGAGRSSEASAPLQVLPAAPAVTGLSASPSPAYVGQNVTIRFTIAGGEAPNDVNITGLPPGCSSASTSPTECVPTAAGTFALTVTVTDAAHRSSNRSASLLVKPAVPVPSVASFSSHPDPVGVGNTTVLSASVTGGLLPLTFTYAGLPEGCASANTSSLSCVPAQAGTFHVSLTARDMLNRSTTSSTVLTVVGNSSSGPGPNPVPASSPAPIPGWLLAVAGAAIVVAVVGVILIRRRSARGSRRDDGESEVRLDEGHSAEDGPSQ